LVIIHFVSSRLTSNSLYQDEYPRKLAQIIPLDFAPKFHNYCVQGTNRIIVVVDFQSKVQKKKVTLICHRKGLCCCLPTGRHHEEPGVNVIKPLSPSSLTLRTNKLERFPVINLFHRDKTRVQMPAKMFPRWKLIC
jgi:hypothetical protein